MTLTGICPPSMKQKHGVTASIAAHNLREGRGHVGAAGVKLSHNTLMLLLHQLPRSCLQSKRVKNNNALDLHL